MESAVVLTQITEEREKIFREQYLQGVVDYLAWVILMFNYLEYGDIDPLKE